jgi:WS/DGAT/MGAT family acyltransferase
VPLARLKAAGRAGGGTLNDAYLAVVTGALRRYHDALGLPVEALRVTMPVNLRVEGDTAGGNRFTPARFTLPIGIADPAARMRAIDELATAWAKDPGLGVSDELAALLNRLPSTVTTEVFGSMLKKIDFVATNVPGSPVPLYLGGAEVTGVYPFAPPSGASVAFGLLSHNGTCCIGINCDTAAVTDLSLLAQSVEEALEEVLALAPAETGVASSADGGLHRTAAGGRAAGGNGSAPANGAARGTERVASPATSSPAPLLESLVGSGLGSAPESVLAPEPEHAAAVGSGE